MADEAPAGVANGGSRRPGGKNMVAPAAALRPWVLTEGVMPRTYAVRAARSESEESFYVPTTEFAEDHHVP